MTRTVWVTGGGCGLSSVIAKTLGSQGFNVIINYNQSCNAAEQFATEIGLECVVALQADVTNRKAVVQLIKKATAHFGKIDVVVNNALVHFKFDPNAQKAFKDWAWSDYQTQIDGTLKAALT